MFIVISFYQGSGQVLFSSANSRNFHNEIIFSCIYALILSKLTHCIYIQTVPLLNTTLTVFQIFCQNYWLFTRMVVKSIHVRPFPRGAGDPRAPGRSVSSGEITAAQLRSYTFSCISFLTL